MTRRAVNLTCRRIPRIVDRVGGHDLTQDERSEAIRVARRVVRQLGIGTGVNTDAVYWREAVKRCGAIPLRDLDSEDRNGQYVFDQFHGEWAALVVEHGRMSDDEASGVIVHELVHHLTLHPTWRRFHAVARTCACVRWSEVIARAVEYAFIESGGLGIRTLADLRSGYGPSGRHDQFQYRA